MTEKINKTEGYNGIYLERSGESAALLVEKLMSEPERPLSEEEQEVAYKFESSLAEYEVGNGLLIDKFIRSVRMENDVAPFVFGQPFVDGLVKSEGIELPEFSTIQDVYDWFKESIDNGSIEPVLLTELAKLSKAICQTQASEALMNNAVISEDVLDCEPIIFYPDEVLNVAEQAKAAREMLLSVRSRYSEKNGANIDGARRAITDIYLARINAIIAQNIPMVDYLVKQSHSVGNVDMQAKAEQAIIPGLCKALHNNERREDVFRRLDYLRNGIGVDENGKASAVSAHVFEGATVESVSNREPLFTPEQVKILKETYLQPDEMVTLFERIISRVGLLSAEDASSYKTTRRVRAHDGLFQVVVNSTKTTFEVSGIDGTYKVPPQPRSLYDVISVGGTHELQHITQAQADEKLGNTLRIAGPIKGKRVSMLREGGANAAQRYTELELFGTAKPIAATYAHALRVLEGGGSVAEAMRAFYEAKKEAITGMSDRDASREAADRVLRLIRRGGRDSQAMSYAEEGILNLELNGLSTSAKARATAIVSLDLVDQVRLHRYGLLPSVDVSIDWSKIVLEEVAPLLPFALSENKE